MCKSKFSAVSNIASFCSDLKDLFGQEKPGYFEYAKEITVSTLLVIYIMETYSR